MEDNNQKSDSSAAGTGAPAGTDHTVEPVPQVYDAIAKCIGTIRTRGVSKSGFNEEHKYKFRSVDQVYGVVSEALALHGLVMLPWVKSVKEEERRSKSGSIGTRIVLEMMYTFVAAVDGSKHEVGPYYGEAIDYSDKAYNKASTGAFKYLCLQVFCIPLEGEHDADANSPETGERVEGTGDKPAGKRIPGEDAGGMGDDDQGGTVAMITAEQAKEIRAHLEKCDVPLAVFEARLAGLQIEEIAADQFEKALEWISKRSAGTKKSVETEKAKSKSPATAAASAAEEKAKARNLALTYRVIGGDASLISAGTKFTGTPSVDGVFVINDITYKVKAIDFAGTADQTVIADVVPGAKA